MPIFILWWMGAPEGAWEGEHWDGGVGWDGQAAQGEWGRELVEDEERRQEGTKKMDRRRGASNTSGAGGGSWWKTRKEAGG